MKFRDGFWRMRPDISTAFPAEAYEVTTTPDSLTVYAPTRRIEHRGQTLGGPLLTLYFWSPGDDVIGLRVTHFTGEVPRPPQFPLTITTGGHVTVRVDEHVADLTAGKLTARIARDGDWR